MNDAEFPISPDARHVEAFLRKIARHRDDELQQIDSQVAGEVVKIRRQAYADARQLVRRVATDTRERERRQRDRFLYKVRSELTRDRWHVLEEIRGRVTADVHRRFEDAWREPHRQWQWCRFWIATAKTLASPADLRLLCGAGIAEDVVEKIRAALVDYPGNVELRIDDAAPSGLLVEWQDHQLDGTLVQQRDAVVATVLSRVAEIIDGRSSSDG